MKPYCHLPFERKTNANTVLLCVHGIQGSPLQFDWIVGNLPEDVDYLCVLLPGHGGSVKRFRNATDAEWRGFLLKICLDLKKKYKRIIYVGHSMGCLLGIDLAAADETLFESMLLLACPIKLKPTLKYFVNNFRAIVGKGLYDPYVDAVYKANSVQMHSPLQIITCIKPYWSLLWLMAQARKQIANMHLPIVLVHSENDEIVSKDSLDYFDHLAETKQIAAPQSGHFVYSAAARTVILREIQRIIGASMQ